MPGEAGFIQWKTAMKALTRLPGGVPKEFRKSVIIYLLISLFKTNSAHLNFILRFGSTCQKTI